MENVTEEAMLVGTKRKSPTADNGGTKKTRQASIRPIPALKFKNLSVGMSIVGAIKEIHDLELMVSLPNNLTGSVAITDISTEFREMIERITENDDEAENDMNQV